MVSTESYKGQHLEAAAELKNYYQWIVGAVRSYLGGHGTEYGAGIGTVSALMRPSMQHLELVEPSPSRGAALSRRFDGDPCVTIVVDTLEGHLPGAMDKSRDTLVLINVLEHIEDDDGALAQFHRVLKPGGHLVLFVPALSFLFSDLDALARHYRRYHLKPMRRQVEAVGLEICVARYMDVLGILPWWLVNTVGGKRELDARMTRLYDRIGIPVTRALERLIPPPVGKNILMVANRPT